MVNIVKEKAGERLVHAFVLGVSRYRHLEDGAEPTDPGRDSGLAQLTSAARSASEFAAWVLESVPEERLASLYVNFAQSPDEKLHPDVAARTPDPQNATRAAVIADWRAFYKKCANNRDATAYVYVAGHGVQVGNEGAIVLLEDFGAPDESVFWAALDLPGMNKTLRGSKTASLQFWFVDCCRERADAQDYGAEKLKAAYVGFDEPEGECDAAPIFFATLPRQVAWAHANGVSLFNEGLLKALRRDAANDPDDDGTWHITTGSLVRALDDHVREASGDLGQKVHLAGHLATTAEVVHVFAEPPVAHLKVTLIPTDAYDVATADIDQNDTNVVVNASDWPIERDLPSGIYIIRVNGKSQFPNKTESMWLRPQSKGREVRLT
ncbi:MAG: hypothetical protein GY906_09575 [bacterium]|nr:hypothetical protein [bacterium]